MSAYDYLFPQDANLRSELATQHATPPLKPGGSGTPLTPEQDADQNPGSLELGESGDRCDT